MSIEGERLARVEEQVLGIRDDIREFMSSLKKQDDKIDKLQSKVNWGYGAGSAIVLAVTLLGESIRQALFGK